MEPGSDTRSNRGFARLGWQASLLTCTNKKRCSHFAAFCNEHHAPQPVDMKTHWQVQQHSKHLVEGLYRWFCRGGSTGIFDWGSGGGGSKLWFGKGCWTVLWQITSPHTPTPVAVARYNSLAPCRVLLCEQRRTDHSRVPKKNYIFKYPRNLV